ncbi:MAG TPA: DUF1800 domain-containing protein, partial [Dehalococcoidia bacterium]|nr:DUF1800 domain-containing protein [Dehalococcoidia bacterium]
MPQEDIALMAHLMRRAGFGATREELEARVKQGYEATVEELLETETQEPSDRLEFLRYHPGFWKPVTSPGMGAATWLYDLINSQRVLQEKMALFWHQVFATGQSKVDHWHEIQNQIDLFREKGMGDYRELLVELARNPAMIYWLDNCDNHAYAVNENWGRELLELFSMGVGNYTEDDVRACSRAFTGWTMSPNIPRNAYGRYNWGFEYREQDHDDGEKTFLGHTGNFNGEDIIDIICQQPATARFIARHLYNFFVADEVPVPSWRQTPPKDLETIKALEQAYFDSGYEIKAMLRALFNAPGFKSESVRFAKVKSPAEMVAGTMRLVGEHREIKPGLFEISQEPKYMGMDLMNPPTVEGWHTGHEWIDSGTLVERINFASEYLGNTQLPGVQYMVNRLMERGQTLAPEQ